MLYVLPSYIFATTYDNVAAGMDYFDPATSPVQDDLSLILLGKVFGSFSGMLPSTSYSVLNPLLEQFNQGIFFVAIGLVSYVTFQSTIKTAEEGKPMGEKTPIFWQLIRPVLGTTFLVPAVSGYSYLQSFMMWAVVAGVSFANQIWDTTVTTFNFYGFGSALNAGANAPIIKTNSSAALTQLMFESELCFKAATEQYNQNQAESTSGGGSTSSALTAAPPASNFSTTGYTLNYTNLPTGYDCGSYNFAKMIAPGDNAYNAHYGAGSIESMVTTTAYSLYNLSQSLASAEYDTMKNLTNPDWSTNTAICSTKAATSSTTLEDIDCNLGLMATTNAATFQYSLEQLQQNTGTPTATPSTTGMTNSGGWLMAAAAYYDFVSGGTQSSDYNYIGLDPKDSFLSSAGGSFTGSPVLCYLSYGADGTSVIKNRVPSTVTDPCNIILPESYLQYTQTNSDATTTIYHTNWLTSDIYATTQPSNVPTYMSLYFASAATTASSTTNNTNVYQAQSCVQKPFMNQDGNFISPVNTTGCTTTTTFTSPDTVNANDLPAVLSAQIYGSAINIFGGQSVSSTFQDNLNTLSTKTKSGIDIKAAGTTSNVTLGASGVSDYSYDEIPIITDVNSYVTEQVFSTWDLSGSGSAFYDIYNNYLASILMLWQNSFLNSDAAEPISAVRDFGLKASTLSLEFFAAMAQKIYLTQVAIMIKYIGYFIGFSLIAMVGSIFQSIIFLISKIVYWALLWFFGLGAVLHVAIYAAAFVPQTLIEPVFSSLANAALMFMQVEIQGTFLWVPILLSTAVPILTLALILAFYAPMIPFLIWCLSAINWMIGVIESMVAAPVVALGIISPQGHDFLGKSELCLMLIFAVFIRPAAMLFGLMFAIFVAYFGFSIFNYMMFYTMQMYLSEVILNVGGKSAAVLMGFLLLLYCYVVLSFINQVFSMIYIIPNKIMRWIGVPVDEPDEQQWLDEIKGGATDAMGGIAGSGSEMGGGLAQSGLAESGGASAAKGAGNVGKAGGG
jgi:hypothetical protein